MMMMSEDYTVKPEFIIDADLPAGFDPDDLDDQLFDDLPPEFDPARKIIAGDTDE
jgi:hypothetical protein